MSRIEWRHAFVTTSVSDFTEAAAQLVAPSTPVPPLLDRRARRRTTRALRRIR